MNSKSILSSKIIFKFREVYLKSGELLKFLDEWKCSQNSTANCAIELAEQFGFVFPKYLFRHVQIRKMEFWFKDDVDLFKEWIRDLIEIGYFILLSLYRYLILF